MNKFKLSLLILLITGVCSCKKNSEEILLEYPVTYESYFISEGEIKVYIKEGEITLPQIKDAIIQRFKNNLSDLGNVEIEEKVVATYLSENKVKVTIDKEEEEKIRFVYEKDGIIYWEKQDTSGIPAYPPLFIGKILIHQPLYYEEFDVPNVTGYSKAAKYKECFYVKKNIEGFELPMFDYVHKTELGQPVILGINNEFNENYLSLIGRNDTILIQKFNIEMKIRR